MIGLEHDMSPRQAQPAPAIELRGVTRTFGRHVAVDDLTLQIQPGTAFGLIGPNGAGKTTTLRMIAGLLVPSAGEVRVHGAPVWADRSGVQHANVGYMPDFFGVYEDMRSWEYLDFFARCHGIAPDRRAALIDELLDLVDLSAKRDTDVDGLSRGMQQRLCLAQALIHDPAVLLLDEPASGLDPRARLEMRALLVELKTLGKTIVISSHILPELEPLCDTIGIMEGGRLAAAGSVGEIGARKRGATEIRVEALGSGATLAERLRSYEGVEIVDEESPGAALPTITFLLDGGPEEQARILSDLVAAGLPVASFARASHRLEDVFMRVTAQLDEANGASREADELHEADGLHEADDMEDHA